MSIAANCSSEIRATLCNDILNAENAKAHNDANILILGVKTIDHEIVFNIKDRFLTIKFEGGRHSTRLSNKVIL
ncbi:ribose-5-phosphate isomerase B [Rickettsia canadensis str. CA410]|uniref:Ribose-5-phosphate isomerase B n=1 Tax=Rickettsia canadensis str. CA410 TaxID=1105107 RepID=A0ABM5MTX9_RICCA|nr:ribose-5-phosphate isomerase B [Rickettsia canadensis str. CA410]